VAFIHGKFGTVYSTGTGFLAFPGILVVLAPVAALNGTLHTSLVEVMKNHHKVANPQVYSFSGSTIPHASIVTFGNEQLAPHPQVLQFLGPYDLILCAVALFACDALAERLGVPWRRRGILGVAEAALLWNLAIRWGHPQDALALAFVVYALIFAIDGRFTGAGWLFGAALALQPLAIVVLPLLLAIGGKDRALGLVLRGIAPAVIVTAPPLAGNFHNTVHALTSQPAFPRRNHATPWTVFAPKLRISGSYGAVGGGPVRVATLVLAAALGWWARRWRSKPEMLAWALALALALRCYTESVMTSYYAWPALALGVVVAARCRAWRFGAATAVAVFTTIAAQWSLGEFPWWAIDIGGITAVLALAAGPEATPEFAPPGERDRRGVRNARAPVRGGTSPSRKKNRKVQRVNRQRSGRR